MIPSFHFNAIAGDKVARDHTPKLTLAKHFCRRGGKLLQRAQSALRLALLKDPQRRNLFPDGGIRLSSTSSNSWMSKISIVMHVCRVVFDLDQDAQIKSILEKADAAHVKWQTEPQGEQGSAYWACSDQMVDGVACGSKYYPRIITSALWME